MYPSGPEPHSLPHPQIHSFNFPEVSLGTGGMQHDPAAVLFLTIGIILLLIKFRMHVGYSVVTGALILILFTLPTEDVLHIITKTASSGATLTLLLLIYSVLLLSYTMESAGMLSRLAGSLTAIGGRLTLIAVPLLIGLLPMPAGALVSAMMLSGVVKEHGISREEATFANYWFRHLWIPTWPLYPAFIITLGVAEINPAELIKINLPLTIAALFAGLLLLRRELHLSGASHEPRAVRGLAGSIWPILAIILLTLVAGVALILSILLVLLLTILLTRPPLPELKKALRRALDPRMGVLIYGVLLFRNGIEASGAAARVMELLSSQALPVAAVAMILSFLVGFAVGIEMAPPSIALPLFISFVGRGDAVVSEHLLLIFTAGYLGVQLSPMHLCFTVTADYFSASISKVYRLLTVAGAVTLLIVAAGVLL